jgi:hypothetical protein
MSPRGGSACLVAAPLPAMRATDRARKCHMTALDWILTSTLFVLYIFLLITVCVLTFQKGHIVLGIVGIFVPFLWLIGAILPAKEGSPYAQRESMQWQAQMNQRAYTQAPS